MNELAAWKPLITALVLPPAPLLLLVLIGVVFVRTRRRGGWILVLSGLSMLWLITCQGTSRFLEESVLKPPHALSGDELQRLKAAGRQKQSTTSLVVLGGGRVPRAEEYGMADLTRHSLYRLRYGMWLSRQTGLPVGYTGGVGWQQRQGEAASEAEIAERIAKDEYGRPLKWTEPLSRDTRENAIRTVRILDAGGYTEAVLVTDAFHMPRAVREFESAAHGRIKITAAPIAHFTRTDTELLDWLPTWEGMAQNRQILREILAGWVLR